MIVELERLRHIAAYAEELLRGRERPGATIDREEVASRLLEILTLESSLSSTPEREAMAELALWSRRSARALTGERLGELLVFELVSVWLDGGRTFDEFVSTLRLAWDGTINARGALGELVGGRSKG